MTMASFFPVLLCGATLFVCISGWSVAAAEEENEQWLSAHNRYRKLHGVPPAVWSKKVAASALAYAETCPSGHSTSVYGENLAWASYDMSINLVVKKWYDEEPRYDYGNPGYVSGVGHFTQIVWKETTEIGCARATGCGPDNSLRANTWICQYSPPGNYRGLFSENVLPPLLEK